jgi:hypothetical protein
VQEIYFRAAKNPLSFGGIRAFGAIRPDAGNRPGRIVEFPGGLFFLQTRLNGCKLSVFGARYSTGIEYPVR